MTDKPADARVLDQIERADRMFRAALFAAVGLEALVITALVLLVNYGQRQEVLILLAALGTGLVVVTSIMVLGIHVKRSSLRVIQAIELLRR